MLSPDQTYPSKDIPAAAADVLERIRARTPRVHCITNAVAQNFSANMLLAAGAIPSMTIAPDEIGEFAARADALLVNLGTFDAERRVAAEIAIEAVDGSRASPGCSIPVFIERSPPRTAFARSLFAKRPRAVRLNRRGVLRALGPAAVDGAALAQFARERMIVLLA